MIVLYYLREQALKRSSKHRSCSIDTFYPKHRKNMPNRLKNRSTHSLEENRTIFAKKGGKSL